MNHWNECTNLLVIRPDNLGDVLMTSPAIRAIKRRFGCKVTLLTSQSGAAAAELLPDIDETIAANFPWAKHASPVSPTDLDILIAQLKRAAFDSCIIFTVYSQNPLPTAMLAWCAGIPRRLAYCRENPYGLLTHWVPDEEPYSRIRHQVVRDLHLAEQIGAYTDDDRITLSIPDGAERGALYKLQQRSIDGTRPYVIFHAGVSESKRSFPMNKWIELTQRFKDAFPSIQVLFTGSEADRPLTDKLCRACGGGTFSLGGVLAIAEFAAVIRKASLVASVNTATLHLTSALGRPLVAFYARTNPQHTPWRCPHVLFPYSVMESELRSRNEVIRFVDNMVYRDKIGVPLTDEILRAMDGLLEGQRQGQFIHQ